MDSSGNAGQGEAGKLSVATNMFKKMDAKKSVSKGGTPSVRNSVLLAKPIMNLYELRFISSKLAKYFYSFITAKFKSDALYSNSDNSNGMALFKAIVALEESDHTENLLIANDDVLKQELEVSAMMLSQYDAKYISNHLKKRRHTLDNIILRLNSNSAAYPILETELKSIESLAKAIEPLEASYSTPTAINLTGYPKNPSLSTIPITGVIMAKITSYKSDVQLESALLNWSSHWVQLDYGKQCITFHDHGPGSPLTMTISLCDAVGILPEASKICTL